MIKDVTLKVIDFGPAWLIGKQTLVKQGGNAADFVKKYRNDGANAYLQCMANKVTQDGDFVIWMGEYNNETKTFVEIPGVLAKPGIIIPDGYVMRELPACTMAICTITGDTRSLSKGAHNKLVKLLKDSEYEPDYSKGFSMEYYSYEKYECKNDIYEFSYYLPCKRAE